MEKIKGFFSKIGSFFKKIFDNINNLDKKKKIILMVCCLAAILLLICLIFFSGNKEASKGNINNKGMVDGSGNTAFLYYFNDNIEDGMAEKNGLYKLSGKKSVLLDKQDNIRSINVNGGFVYYVTINPADYHREIVRIRKNGKDKQVLVDDIEATDNSGGEMIVHKNNVYFIGNDNKLEVMSKKGDNRKTISDEEMLSFQIVDKTIYFISQNYEMKKMSIDGNNVEKISDDNVISFQVVEKSIYYINMNDEYLKKMDLDGKNSEDVIDQVVRYYNISDGYLYYYKTDADGNNSIYKKKLNSDNETKIVDLDGAYTSICVVGKWIYYIDREEDSYYYYTVYRVKTDGKDKQVIKVE